MPHPATPRYRCAKATDAAWRIVDNQGNTVATAIAICPAEVKRLPLQVGMAVEFLNHPVRATLAFDCRVTQRSLPYLIPADDEATEEFTEIVAPDQEVFLHVSDYGQGVKLCQLLNREIH